MHGMAHGVAAKVMHGMAAKVPIGVANGMAAMCGMAAMRGIPAAGGARGAAARTMHTRSLEVKPSARKPMAPPGQPLAPRKGPGQLERQFCPKCFILAECHAVGNGRKRCVSCSKTYKAGAVPSRVPACPLCGGYSVTFNGASFMCTSCNKAFRPPRGNALKAYRTRAAVGA